MSYNMEPFHDDFEDQLQKDAMLDQVFSDATTASGAEMPELEDLEDLEPRRMMAMRPSRQGLNGVPGMEDVVVRPLPELAPTRRRAPCVPCRTWAITPDHPEALKPPCKEDPDQKSVDFHPMVTMHLFRP
ncbi:unnamed protein product [Durusdinium trenchii]|uniref:Uncharacterized protein n=2 Tax=Durusdinium trenchii TaxID=1381693 RepID=A0ABP0ICB6_9DINO